MSYLFVKYLHFLGSAVLFGTGLGIAFFMLMAVRTGQVVVIAATARIVVVADGVFTFTAAVLQPITGALLVSSMGYGFSDVWIVVSLGLYVLIGLCWVPVVFMQLEMARLAEAALAEQVDLPERFYQLYRRWFWLGWPAFFSMVVIFWLMVYKPSTFLGFQ